MTERSRSGLVRIWCIACARDARPTPEFAARVRELARQPEIRLRSSDRAEFVAALELDGEWRDDALAAVDELCGAPDAGEVVWLAEPETIARRLAETLGVPASAATRLAPRAFTLTALDHASSADATRRPALAGFELDWLPPSGGGSGAFPGATPRR